MTYKIEQLDFSISSHEYFEFIKNNDWAIYLNSNNQKYSDQRFDILTSDPVEKIIHDDENSLVKSEPLQILVSNILLISM